MTSEKLTTWQLNKVKEKVSRALFFTVFGTILPLIIGAIILVLFSQYGVLKSFIYDGTFCLFAAALLTSASYLFSENAESITTREDKIVSKYCQPVVIIVAMIYGAVFAKETLSIDKNINVLFMWFISITSFTYSIWALYRALYLEGLKNPPSPDAGQERSDEIDDLKSQLL